MSPKVGTGHGKCQMWMKGNIGSSIDGGKAQSSPGAAGAAAAEPVFHRK
jgi:hypothetical protein